MAAEAGTHGEAARHVRAQAVQVKSRVQDKRKEKKRFMAGTSFDNILHISHYPWNRGQKQEEIGNSLETNNYKLSSWSWRGL